MGLTDVIFPVRLGENERSRRMPGPKAVEITLSAEEQAALEQLVRRHSLPQQIALRARIILAAAQGRTNNAI